MLIAQRQMCPPPGTHSEEQGTAVQDADRNLATLPEGVTPSPIELATSTEITEWDSDGYAYVSYTATEEGYYKLTASCAKNVGGPECIDVAVCADSSNAYVDRGSTGNDSGWLSFITCHADNGQVLTFRVPSNKQESMNVIIEKTEFSGNTNPGGNGDNNQNSAFVRLGNGDYANGIGFECGSPCTYLFVIRGETPAQDTPLTTTPAFEPDDNSTNTITFTKGNSDGEWSCSAENPVSGNAVFVVDNVTYKVHLIANPKSGGNPGTGGSSQGGATKPEGAKVTNITVGPATTLNDWNTETDGVYAYVNFTAENDGSYQITANGDTLVNSNAGRKQIALCTGTALTVTGSSNSFNDSTNTWQGSIIVKMSAGETATVQIPQNGFQNVTVKVEKIPDSSPGPGPSEPAEGTLCIRSGPNNIYRTALTFNWQYTPNCQFYIKGADSSSDTLITEQPTFVPDGPNATGTITVSPSSAPNTWMFQASAPVKGKLVFSQTGKSIPVEAIVEYPNKDEIALRISDLAAPWYLRSYDSFTEGYHFNLDTTKSIRFALVQSDGNGNDTVLSIGTATVVGDNSSNFTLSEKASDGSYTLTASSPSQTTLKVTYGGKDYSFDINAYTSGGTPGGGDSGGSNPGPGIGDIAIRIDTGDANSPYTYPSSMGFTVGSSQEFCFVLRGASPDQDVILLETPVIDNSAFSIAKSTLKENYWTLSATAVGTANISIRHFDSNNQPTAASFQVAANQVGPGPGPIGPGTGDVALRVGTGAQNDPYSYPTTLTVAKGTSQDVCFVLKGQTPDQDTVLTEQPTVDNTSVISLIASSTKQNYWTITAVQPGTVNLKITHKTGIDSSMGADIPVIVTAGPDQPTGPEDGALYFSTDGKIFTGVSYSADEATTGRFYVYDKGTDSYTPIEQAPEGSAGSSSGATKITSIEYVSNSVYDPEEYYGDLSAVSYKYLDVTYDETNNLYTLTPHLPHFGMFVIGYTYKGEEKHDFVYMTFSVPRDVPSGVPTTALSTENIVAPTESDWVSGPDPNQKYAYFTFTPSISGYYKVSVTADGHYGQYFNCALTECGEDTDYITETKIYNDTDSDGNDVVTTELYGKLQRGVPYSFRYSYSDPNYTNFKASVEKTLNSSGNYNMETELKPVDGQVYFGLLDGTHSEKLEFSDNYTLVTLDLYNSKTRSFTTLTSDQITPAFYMGPDKDNGSFLKIEDYEDGYWKLTPVSGCSGQLRFVYNDNPCSLALTAQPKVGPPVKADPITIDNTTNTATLDNNAKWTAQASARENYTYVSYTPTTTGRYKITALAKPKQDERINAGIDICEDGASALEQTYRNNNAEEWIASCLCTLEAGKTYTFQILAEPEKLDGSITVKVETATADETLSGPQDYYPVPAPGWPNAGTATNDKILHYTSGMKEVNVAAKTEGSEDKYLVSRGQDWNVVYVTYTPDHDGIYKLAINSKDGYTYKADDPVMPQTFRVVQSALWANGGCQFLNTGSIALADYYQLKKGVTYQFQLLLCKHGIDFTKDLNFSITEDVLPLNAKNVFEGDRSTVNSTVDGFYSEDKNTKNVVVNAVEDTQGQAVTTSNVTITAAAAVTISEGQVDSATIQTNVADVKFDDAAIDKIGAEPKDSSLVISQSTDEKAVTKTVELTMTQENQPLLPEKTQENNGTITVTVPYDDVNLANGDKVIVQYCPEMGPPLDVDATYNADTKTVTFTTTHFSTYMISTEKNACSHQWGEWTTTTEATCTTDGTETSECSVCHTKQQQTIKATGKHTYGDWTVTKEPTCTEAGERTHTCTVCSKTETEPIAKLGHSFGEWKTDKAATCTTDKTELRECATCHTQEHRTVEHTALGHDFTDYKSDGNATCTKDGTKTAKCSRCDATDTKPDTGSKKDHSWGEYKSNGNATCTEDGTKTRECTVCHTKQTVADTGSKLGHDYKDRVCTRCGAWESACDGGETCPTHGYTDVDQALWYHDYVDFVVANGVMTGTCAEPLRFEPESILTRAQMVEALWKLEGKPQVDKAPAFTDVKKDDWFYASLSWAYSIDLAQGVGNDLFQPDAKLTREQMVTFLYRYAKYKGLDVTAAAIPGSFTDASDVSKYAREPFAWAIEHEIVQGMTSTTLVPQGQSKRSFLAKILTQYLKLAA